MYLGVIQCCNCWHWEHLTHICYTQGTKCQKCSRLHRVKNHRSMAWCYKADLKSNSSKETTTDGVPCPYTFKCINCKGKHSTNNTKYSF